MKSRYPDGVLYSITMDVLGDTRYLAMLKKNYDSLYTVIYNSLLGNDPTRLPFIESVLYGLVISFKDIPLNMDHGYRYGDLLRKVLQARLKRGI